MLDIDEKLTDSELFHQAFENDDISSLFQILGEKNLDNLDINMAFGSDSQTCLHIAANENYIEMTRMLFRKAAGFVKMDLRDSN